MDLKVWISFTVLTINRIGTKLNKIKNYLF